MAECNDSNLLDGGDSLGMTNEQYKGFLLDHLRDLRRIHKLAVEAGNTEIQAEVEEQIETINEKLKF